MYTTTPTTTTMNNLSEPLTALEGLMGPDATAPPSATRNDVSLTEITAPAMQKCNTYQTNTRTDEAVTIGIHSHFFPLIFLSHYV